MPTSSKIVFVSHGNTANGAELCLAETVKSLNLQGGSEVYVFLQKGGAYLESLLKVSGAKVIHFDIDPRWVDYKLKSWREWIGWLKKTATNFIKFRKVLLRLRPDYVVSNTIVCNPSFALATRICGIHHAWYIHELGDRDHGYTFYLGKRLTWAIVRMLSNKVMFNSQFTQNYFLANKSFNKEKFSVIYYGVPINRFKHNGSCFDEKILKKWNHKSLWRILIAGRTVEGKGQEDIITALGLLKNVYKKNDFHLTILGKLDGPYCDKLDGLINKYDLMQHISIIPFTDNPEDYFAESHIGVTTSRNEAFGRITVEYMKSNMVVIGGKAGGTTEIIEDKISGYLYELGDMDHFARLILHVMSDFDAAKILAAKSKAISESKFNLEKHGTEIMKLLFNR